MKNFEAVSVAAAVLTTFAAFAIAEVPAVRHTAPAVATATAAAAPTGTMQVVVIKAKRLTAAEKAALD